MSAQIIQFPPTMDTAQRPSFRNWLTDRVGGTWTVVKQRNYTRGWRGHPWPEGHVLLLSREYRDYKREYLAGHLKMIGA